MPIKTLVMGMFLFVSFLLYSAMVQGLVSMGCDERFEGDRPHSPTHRFSSVNQ